MVSDKVVIKNPTGLHLRPAGLFCKTAMQYKSKITVYKKMKNEEVNANAKSVLSVLGACIKKAEMRLQLFVKEKTKKQHFQTWFNL